MNKSYVYILLCADETYYTGVTSNLEQRFQRHQSGYYPNSYTSSRRPILLVFFAEFTDIRVAIKKEKQIKKWSKAKKKALIDGNFGKLVNLAKKKF